jgi:hypothetical protein
MDAELLSKIPTSVFVVIGILVILNLGTIVTVVTAVVSLAFKSGKFVKGTEIGIKDAKDTGVRAHKRQDISDKRHELSDKRISKLEEQ